MKKSMIFAAALLSVTVAGAQKYNMVVETTDGSKTYIPLDNIASMQMTPQPNYIEADHLVYAMYTTQPASPEMAIYRVDFANAPVDESLLPAEVGDLTLSVEFTAPKSEIPFDAILPAGNYKAGNNTANFTFNCSRSDIAIRVKEGSGEDAISYEVIIGGYIDVAYVDGEYDIRAELVTVSGNTVNASYAGPISFVPNPANSESFTEDQVVEFTGAQGRFYANWYYPFADDMRLQFYTGTFNADDQQTEGYWLDLEINMPKADNPRKEALPNPRVADGVYTVDLREDPGKFYYCYHPFTFISGKTVDVMGQVYNIGSNLAYKSSDGRLQIAHLTGGTLIVSENGTKFVLEATTLEGVKVSGTYNGAPAVVNFCDNFDNQPPRPYSTLTADYEMHFANNAIALAYDEGDNFLIQGKKSMYLMVSDPQQLRGDYVAFDLIADENGLVDGTYNVNDTFEPFGVIKGRADYGGQAILSWFGNLEKKDGDGYNLIMAPVYGGSFTVATDAQGVTTITFNLMDDNNHKITGSWTGTVTRVSDEDLTAASARSALRLK